MCGLFYCLKALSFISYKFTLRLNTKYNNRPLYSEYKQTHFYINNVFISSDSLLDREYIYHIKNKIFDSLIPKNRKSKVYYGEK